MTEKELTDKLRSIAKRNPRIEGFKSGGDTYMFMWDNGIELNINPTQKDRLVLFGEKVGCLICSIEELPDVIDIIECYGN